ncbi:hypothetical protein N7465_007134 [Penicillium sp. CMV-2018d]|nr:hypothetical protein N7465_007134 [Penicillium sp. CMV-2018d]
MFVRDERRQIVGRRVGVMAIVETGGEISFGNEDSRGRAGRPSARRQCVAQIRRRIRRNQPENVLTERTDRAIGEMRGVLAGPHQAGESPPPARRWVSRHVGDSGE